MTAPRHAPAASDLALFRAHVANLDRFTSSLADQRCRRTDHFDARLADTVSVFGPLLSRWNMEIVYLLYMGGPLRFNRIKETLAGVSSRVLTDKLRHLESIGVIVRKVGAEHNDYHLTPRGERIARLLHPLLFFLHNETLVTASGTA